MIDLRSARKAKASARVQLGPAWRWLDKRDWGSQYQLDVQPAARTYGVQAFER
jgi:hypothetical protein